MEVLKTRAAVTSLIKTVSEEHGISEHVITNVRTNQTGEGYLGEIFMVTVKDSSSNKQLAMVIKAAFLDQKMREMAPIRISFQNEINFYTEVHPLYEKLDKENGISQSTQYVPKCLKVSVRDEEEMLALEDLKSGGFEIFDKKLILDDDHVKLILEVYGRLHGYSFVLRDQHPEEYGKVTKTFFNVYEEFGKQSYWSNYMMEISKLVQSALVPGEDDKVIKNFEKYSNEKMNDIFYDVSRENVEYSAILHGDGWTNNMLFKYEDTVDGRRPVEMRLIDWQMIIVGSPVCDLSYCLYSGASKKVFDNLNDYLKIYHDALSNHVRRLGSDPEKLFPFSILEEHWKKYAKWGMIMAVQALKLKLLIKEDRADSTDAYNVEELTDTFFHPKIDEKSYKARVRELLWHMCEVDAL